MRQTQSETPHESGAPAESRADSRNLATRDSIVPAQTREAKDWFVSQCFTHPWRESSSQLAARGWNWAHPNRWKNCSWHRIPVGAHILRHHGETLRRVTRYGPVAFVTEKKHRLMIIKRLIYDTCCDMLCSNSGGFPHKSSSRYGRMNPNPKPFLFHDVRPLSCLHLKAICRLCQPFYHLAWPCSPPVHDDSCLDYYHS